MKYYDTIQKGFYEAPTLNSIEITDEYWLELQTKNSQGGIIQEIDGQVFCLMPYEKVKDGQIIDVSDTDIYKNQIRLGEIEKELIQAEADYVAALDSPIEYTNGHTYKPRYAAETYQAMLSSELVLKQAESEISIFPKTINDSTQLSANAVSMTYEELMTLTLFLAQKAEIAWNEKAVKINDLLTEKTTIEETEA